MSVLTATQVSELDNMCAGANRGLIGTKIAELEGRIAIKEIPTITIGAHDYAGAAVDWTLSASERLVPAHKPTNANGAVNAIIPVAIKPYIFINATGQALTVKTPAGTGITIANGKAQQVMSDGTNVIAIAAVTA